MDGAESDPALTLVPHDRLPHVTLLHLSGQSRLDGSWGSTFSFPSVRATGPGRGRDGVGWGRTRRDGVGPRVRPSGEGRACTIWGYDVTTCVHPGPVQEAGGHVGVEYKYRDGSRPWRRCSARLVVVCLQLSPIDLTGISYRLLTPQKNAQPDTNTMPARLYTTSLDDVQVLGEVSDKPLLSEATPKDILTIDALKFVVLLHRTFNATRKQLLANRQEVQKKLDAGESLHFLKETEYIRNDPNWKCLPTHPKLMSRKVEITGPPDAKMIINAFNTDVHTYMTDFEDSCAPTWSNMLYGQVNLYDAIRDKIDFTNEKTGKRYKINKEGRRVPVMIVRPRGWHMVDSHITVAGEPISASILDFGLFFFHNAKYLISQGLGPFFYLPKMEHWLEANLWNDIFCVAQDCLEIPRGTIKATVLIETLPISYQLDEVLYALREHSSGLNCGRWDYMFSTIKRLRNQKDHILPDRQQVTMTVPFMTNYVRQLIKTCHKRGVHAMGGMAAFIPIKDDPAANATALEAVRKDKLREVLAGHDGTWIAHPGLLETALSVFEEHMPTPNQLFVQKSDVITESMLVDTNIQGGEITTRGLNANIYIGLNYMESWLRGLGCVPINHLMEDAATAEVSRLQLWSWCKHQVKMNDTGKTITPEYVSQLIDEEVAKVSSRPGNKYAIAAQALKDELTGAKPLAEFLTDILYPYIATPGAPIDLATLKK